MEIPGYKYDNETNRYYKILKTGQYPGNKYTISAVAEHKRQEERKSDSSRIDHIKQEYNLCVCRRSIFEAAKLGSIARVVFPSRSASPVTQFCLTPQGPVCGHQNGQISTITGVTAQGRSIIGLDVIDTGIVAASVDTEFGSILASPHGTLPMPGLFVTGICATHDSKIYAASDRGICLWDLNTNDSNIMRIGSFSALTFSKQAIPQSILFGKKNGGVISVDERSGSVESLFYLTNRKMVTNLASLDSHRVICSGLEDQMWMYDLRNTKEPSLKFAEYKNWSTYRHGLSLNQSGNCVAVGLDDGSIRVYDCTSGISLKQIKANSRKSIVTYMRWNDAALYLARSNKLMYLSNRGLLTEPNSRGEDNTFLDDLNAVSNNLNTSVY